jgi:hypothetical protein
MPTLATLSISKQNLITCIAYDNAHNQSILDLIINDKDESYKIIVIRHPPPTPIGFVKCETCSFEQPNYIDTCQMCQMRFTTYSDYKYSAPDPKLITLSRYSSLSVPLDSSLSVPLDSVASDPVFDPIISQALELETNITTETSSLYNSESNSVIAEYNNTPVNPNTINLGCKLYIKNFIFDVKFIDHFNFALCRARNIEYENHIIGMNPLSKTSCLIEFSSEFYTTLALQLDNNVLWNGSYVRLQRPQGYKASTNNIFTSLTLNIVQEVVGVDYYELKNKEKEKEKKKKTKEKEKEKKNINTIINTHPVYPHAPKNKITPVAKPEITPLQKELVESLHKTLRKGALECLEILCSHDGRETSVYFEPLAELCSILHDHKVLSCEVKAKQMLIKGFGQNMSYNIEKGRAGDHIKLHSIADVRALLRDANFPESAFS